MFNLEESLYEEQILLKKLEGNQIPLLNKGDKIYIGEETYLVIDRCAFHDKSLTIFNVDSKVKLLHQLIPIKGNNYSLPLDLETGEVINPSMSDSNPFYIIDKYGQDYDIGTRFINSDGDDYVIQAWGYLITRNLQDTDYYRERDLVFLGVESNILFTLIDNKEDSLSKNKTTDNFIIESDLSEFNEQQVAYLHMINDFEEFIKDKFKKENAESKTQTEEFDDYAYDNI